MLLASRFLLLIFLLELLYHDHSLAPPMGYVSLTVDDAYSHTQNRMGMGGVVQDSRGTWQFGLYAGLQRGDPFLAELHAVRTSLQLLWRKDIKKAHCEYNCLEVVASIRKEGFHFQVLLVSLWIFISFWCGIGTSIFTIFLEKLMALRIALLVLVLVCRVNLLVLIIPQMLLCLFCLGCFSSCPLVIC